MVDIIIDNIMLKFNKVPVHYGTPVGLITSQAISSVMTQYIIDSKHRSGTGAGSSTSGVVKLKDILRATAIKNLKSPPTMLISLLPKYENNKYMAEFIANHIEMIPLSRFVNEVQIFYEEYGKPVHPQYIKESEIISLFDKHNPYDKPINITNWCIRMELSKIDMNIKNITLDDIVTELQNNFKDIYFVYTSDNVSNTFLEKVGVKSKDVIILRCYIKSSLIEGVRYNILNSIISIKDSLLNNIIRGVDGIISAKVHEMPSTSFMEDGSAKISKVFKIRTTGSNINKLMDNKYIRTDSLITSSIIETMETYGIEAAREMIINEIANALSGIAYAHFSIYGDEMTHTGIVTSIEKLGVSRREPHNILHQMAIKDPLKTIENAVNSATKSNIYGVSPSLMMGMTSRTLGTSYNKVMMDTEFIKQNKKTLSSIIEEL